MEQTTPNGKIKVQITWPEVLPDELYNIEVRFLDPNTDELLEDVIFDVVVTQKTHAIETYYNQHSADGNASYEVMFEETGLAVVSVTILGVGGSKQLDEQTIFFVDVVPEFPFSYGLVMALSIISAILVSRRFHLLNLKLSY